MKSMKTVSALAFALFGVLALGAPTSVRAQLGIAAGANFTDIEDIESGGIAAPFENSTGYHVGVFFQAGGGALSIRPGIVYHKLGTFEFPTGDEIDLSSVEVPVDLLVSIAPSSPISPYLLGGPVLTFPRGDNESVEDVSLTADLGVGIRFDLSGFLLMPELRYSIGVTDYLSDDFQVGDVTVQPSDDDRRLSKLMLRLNLMF